MNHELHFSVRIPERFVTQFKNYATIQVLAANVKAQFVGRERGANKKAIFTFHLQGDSPTKVERVRSKLAARAIVLEQVQS